MSSFIPWDSQPLDSWASKHAPGNFIDLEGHSTHYLERGEGEPIILLHGFFFDMNMWTLNLQALARKFKVYALDFWGFGYSTRKPMDYGYPLFAEQVRLFMDALNLSKASFAGQSMGGGTIVKFAVANRDRVEKVILVDPAGMPNKLPIMGRISNLAGVGEMMYRFNSDFMRRLSLRMNFIHRKELLTEDLYADFTRFHKIKRSSEVMLYVTRKQFFDTLLDEIKAFAGLRIPTLLIWGREEPAIPLPIGLQFRDTVNPAQFAVLDDAGHCPNIDQAETFNQLAVEFLSH